MSKCHALQLVLATVQQLGTVMSLCQADKSRASAFNWLLFATLCGAAACCRERKRKMDGIEPGALPVPPGKWACVVQGKGTACWLLSYESVWWHMRCDMHVHVSCYIHMHRASTINR
jgi:hypothetical protein